MELDKTFSAQLQVAFFTNQQDVTSTGRRPSVGNGGEGASLGTVGDHQ